MRAVRTTLTAAARDLSRWWWALFLVLISLDIVAAVIDEAMGRKFPTGLQVWTLVQALLATLGVAILAVVLRDIGFAIVGSLFFVLVLEDWLSPLRLRVRIAMHDLMPWLGEAPDRLTKSDPADLVLVLAAAAAVLAALWAARPHNRVHVLWLFGFLAFGFVFGGLVDLYNDNNFSRLGVFIEEGGEAIAISGTLAYLTGVVGATLGTKAMAER